MRAAGFCASSLYCLATIAATGHADGDRRRQTIRPDTEGQVRNVFPRWQKDSREHDSRRTGWYPAD